MSTRDASLPLAAMPQHPLSIDRPLFIVGAGRSGTTLLRSLLSAHPRLAIAPETHFMQRCRMNGGLVADAPADFRSFWTRFTASTRFKDLGIDAGVCRQLIDTAEDRSFRGIFTAVLAAYGRQLDKPRVGEKTPGHVFFLRRLFEWFPDARVLVVRRDPRAVVASKLLVPWRTLNRAPFSVRDGLVLRKRLLDTVVEAGRWAEIYEQAMPEWDGDARVLSLSYETLVVDLERELGRVCAFIGEPFDEAMVTDRSESTVPEGIAGMPDVPEEWRRQHYQTALRPVSTDSLDKWKRQLSSLELAIVEGRCIRGMRAQGYVPALPARRRLVGQAVSRAVLAAAWAEQQARTTALARRLLDA